MQGLLENDADKFLETEGVKWRSLTYLPWKAKKMSDRETKQSLDGRKNEHPSVSNNQTKSNKMEIRRS